MKTLEPAPSISDHRQRALELYLQGWSDVDIARELGLSRERIRQYRGGLGSGGHRQNREPFPPREWVHPTPLAHDRAIADAMQGGMIQVSHSGMVLPREVEAYLAKLRQRPCDACGQPLNDIARSRRWCDTCSAERVRYGYPFLDVEQRRAHAKAVKSWSDRHRAKARQINRRAMLTYKLVKAGMPREQARREALAKYPK